MFYQLKIQKKTYLLLKFASGVRNAKIRMIKFDTITYNGLDLMSAESENFINLLAIFYEYTQIWKGSDDWFGWGWDNIY